jgi:predicted MFS family arabinose efflux permease
LRLFADRNRLGTYLVMLATGAGVFAMFYFLTQYIQDVLHFSALSAGFAFLPVSATIIVVAQLVSKLVVRVPARLLIANGSAFAGGGLIWMSTLSPGSSYVTHVLPALMLVAIGMGFVFVPITLAAVSGVARQDAGIASAMLNVVQQVGGTIGLSALVTVFGTAYKNYVVDHHSNAFAPAFTHAADMAFRVGAVFSAAGLVAAIVFIRVRPGDNAGEPTVGAGH